MFTGIIEEKGRIILVEKQSNMSRFIIEAVLSKKLQEGDSIAVDGACLTVVNRSEKNFAVEAIKQTLELTILQYSKADDFVNLETALTLSKPLSGHLVLGHVDTMAHLRTVKKEEQYIVHAYEIPEEFARYLVYKGSIAINGISLTMAKVHENIFEANIIPYTIENTTLGLLKKNEPANIEFDIIGKYIYNFLEYMNKDSLNNQKEEKLRKFLQGM